MSTSWLFTIPTIIHVIFLFFAFIYTFVSWRKSTLAAMLVFIGLILHAVAIFGVPLLQIVISQSTFVVGYDRMSYFAAVSICSSLLNVVAWTLMLAAVFAGRNANDEVPQGIDPPVDPARSLRTNNPYAPR